MTLAGDAERSERLKLVEQRSLGLVPEDRGAERDSARYRGPFVMPVGRLGVIWTGTQSGNLRKRRLPMMEQRAL